MTTEVTVILISTAAISIGIFLWRKYKAGIERINTVSEQKIAEIIARGRNDAENIRKALELQIESLQSKIERLQKAFDALKEVDEKITACIRMVDGAAQQPAKTGKQEKATSKKTGRKEE
jgi:alanyl-tRNA synthetase